MSRLAVCEGLVDFKIKALGIDKHPFKSR